MTARFEAAAIAFANEQMSWYDLPLKNSIEQVSERAQDATRAALAAADAVMFSDEAVERAAEALYMTGPAAKEKHWEDIGRQRQDYFKRRARAVIAALKGDDA